jgi:hypothetical protein
MSIGLTFQQYFMRVPLFDRRSRRAAPIRVSRSDCGTLQNVIPAVFKPESGQMKENLVPG